MPMLAPDLFDAVRAAEGTHQEVADRFGLTHSMVQRIRSGRTVRPDPLTRLSPAERASFWRPACMDDAEWTAWTEINRSIATQSAQASRPCEDCTAEFAAEMRRRDRCNGEPGETAHQAAQAAQTSQAGGR
jgi:transcriptional regulator with XRE-family HTH domain